MIWLVDSRPEGVHFQNERKREIEILLETIETFRHALGSTFLVFINGETMEAVIVLVLLMDQDMEEDL